MEILFQPVQRMHHGPDEPAGGYMNLVTKATVVHHDSEPTREPQFETSQAQGRRTQ
jgi:hypothetical protein